MRNKCLQNIDIRKAIYHSINYIKLLKTSDEYDPQHSTSILPFGIFGSVISGSTTYNIKLAKNLANDVFARYPSCKNIDLEYIRDNLYSPVDEEMQLICKELKTAGFNCILHKKDYSQVINKIVQGKFFISRVTYTPDYPDPDAFYYPFLYSKQRYNSMKYSSPRVDDLIDQARYTFDKVKRFNIYTEIASSVMSDLPIIPLYYRAITIIYNTSKISKINMPKMGVYHVRFKDIM